MIVLDNARGRDNKWGTRHTRLPMLMGKSIAREIKKRKGQLMSE